MTHTIPAAQRPRPWLRRAGWTLAGLFAFAAALGALTLDLRPMVVRPPDSVAARNALAAGETLRDFIASGGAADEITLSDGEADAVLAAASRLVQGLDGAARPVGSGLALDLSVGPPHLPAGLWANLSFEVDATPEGLRLERARLGRLPLPAGLIEEAAVRAVDRKLGAALTRRVLAGVEAIDISGDRITARLGYDPAERRALLDEVRARLGADERDKGPIYAALWWLNRGGETGDLPGSGSALPWLRWGLERAGKIAARYPQASDRDIATAAFVSLAMVCGEPAIGAAVGLQPRDKPEAEALCAGTKLGDRLDLRKHFSVSAALYALSTGDAAFGVGELKELVDSGPGGSGFSFDDMAANLAGARFAAAFLETPRADWPALLERAESEEDVLPDLAGLPTGLTPEEFASRFGAVDSPAYREMIAEIRARVAALPLETARAGR